MKKNMMKVNVLLVLLTFSFFAQSQQKYQSLFWKITSPEKTEPSYLYGTMHVSDKIAYYLNDAFYEAILSVEYIALESDPNEWLEAFDDGRMSKEVGSQSEYYNYRGFYRAFCPEPNDEEYIGYYLSQGNQLLNGILYRNSLYEEDFQEDTYLDMFIYQTGRKYNKKFTGLEDYDISTDLVNSAMLYYEYDDDFEPWLKKLLKEKSYVELMEDAYRDQNLDFLDSLNVEFNNELYNQFMIDDRNIIMANSIDSVMQLGSVFAGIGAAHLPGELGVINLLIEKGYKVEPIIGDLTEKGEALSAEIKGKRTVAPFSKQTSPDGMLTVDWLNKLYEFSDGILVSPDITNGAYVLISRMNRYTYLFPNEPCDLETIDKLIFEKVPGEIISKDRIEVSGYPAIALLNQTKDGDYQKYYIVETPLEVVIFKMDGPEDYVLKYGDDFFNNISFKSTSSEFQKVFANFKGYSVNVPSFYKVENHSGFASYILQPVLQAFDVTDSSFSFVINLALDDLVYIEEDDFEEKMIHKRFYETLELKNPTYYQAEHLSSKAPIIKNDSIPTGDTLYLKTVLSGNQYFLKGYFGSSSKKSTSFFNSFKQHKYQYLDSLELKTDTVLCYTVSTYDDPPYHYLENMFGDEEKNDKKKYQQITENYLFTAPNKEQIKLTYIKFPLYSYYENVDSLWSSYERSAKRMNTFGLARNSRLGNNDDENALRVAKTEKGKINHKFPYFDIYLNKNGSSKYIKNRYVLNHGVVYKLSVMQDSSTTPTEFVSTFFETFSPLDTAIGYSPFVDKTDMFLEDVYSTDTLRKEAALKSIYAVKFGEEYLPQLYALIDTFPFEENELKYRANLVNKVGKMNIPATNKYMIDLYKQSEYNSVIQMAIIRALASHQDPESTETILNLLESDIPLPEQYVILNGFRSYYDSLELAADLYPEFLKYGPIDEYKRLVFGLLSDLKENGYNAKKYKKMKDFLVTEGRIELKRLKAKELKNSAASYRTKSLDNTMLSHYITLLSPWQHQTQIKNLFEKISSVDDIETLIHLALAKKSDGNSMDLSVLKKVLATDDKIDELVKILIEKEQEEVLNQLGITQDAIAMADLIDATGDKLKTHELLRNEALQFNGSTYQIYLYQYKIEENQSSYSYNSSNGDKWMFGVLSYKIPDDGKTKLSVNTFYRNTSKGYDNFVITPGDEEEIEAYYQKCLEFVEYKGRKRVKVEEEVY